LDSDSLESFQERANLYFVYKKISNLKRRLRVNPKNSILWIEIARYYSIIGQNKQAERSIKNAFQLSPQNRFVLRAMARFFTHIGKIDYAHDIIRKLPITKHDPWVMATEISLAMKRGRFSRFIKPAFNIVNSSNFHPFNISELNSSLGTLERETSLKKSKKLFNDSLIKPNDNSLAQAEWISHQESNFLRINPSEFEIENNYEAKARDASEHERWDDSVDYAKLWFLDMPFSRGAILFGSQIASNNLNNHDEVVSLYKAGLTSHPNDWQMLNNIVYSLCLNDRLDEAEIYLSRFDDNQNNIEHQTCITATRGLFYFRKGFTDLGRRHYYEAMNMASEAKNQLLINIAFVNYVREEYISGNSVNTELVNRISELRLSSKNKTIQKIISDIDKLINFYE
jgi:Flp pilus assembly protein TadD